LRHQPFSCIEYAVSMTVDLISPLSAEECVQRLRFKTAEGWSGSVVGSVGETSFRLRKRIGYRNSFQTSLYGKIIAEDGQTRLHCRAGLHPFVRVFMTVWFGVVSIGCGAMVIRAIDLLRIGHGSLLSNGWQGAAVPFFMLGFGVTLIGAGRHLARDERDFLIDYVRRAVDAREG
jgi:hypothetical protein